MFSPSPFPNRNQAQLGHGSPPVAGRRSRVGSQRPPSRRVTPIRVSDKMTPLRDVSMASGDQQDMDIEERSLSESRSSTGAVIFAKSERLQAVLHAPLPLEVKQVLRTTDFARDFFTGDVDATTGFSLIASFDTCFAWQHSQLILGTTTCYIFPAPQDYSSKAPPFACITPFGPNREPGLLLVSPGGIIRFWDSVGMGLTGGEHWDSSTLEFEENETVTALVRAESQVFVASTSAGNLFRLTISSTLGKFHVINHKFTLTRPQSGMSRLKFWSAPTPAYSSGNINAIAIGPKNTEGFSVWSCLETTVCRWTVNSEGWEQLDFEVELSQLLSPGFYEAFPTAETDDGVFDLEMVDLCIDRDEELVVLASFAGHEDESGMDSRPRRFYAVARLRINGDALDVLKVSAVPYQTISADKANIHPRLHLLNRDTLYCVQFGDAVAIVAKDSAYTSCLTLKSIQDRTFGCGHVEGSNEFLLMNSSVLMKVEFDQEKVKSFDPETGRATIIRSIMTQAILYGSNPDNPLLFNFPPDVDEESLISGAEQLSRAVLASDIEVVRPHHDLTRQLQERKDRLRFLIGFINENGALGKMSQSSRQRLLSDAEKLYAAERLWVQYCERVSAGFYEGHLIEAVRMFMEDHGEGHHEDIMRAFFRLQARDLGDLLSYVVNLRDSIRSSWELQERFPDPQTATNQIILIVVQSAWDYRKVNSGVYGIVRPYLRPWTSKPPIIDILLNLFNTTAEAIDKAILEDDEKGAQENRLQLPHLAAAVFGSFQERLDWLESPIATDEHGTEGEKSTLREKFWHTRLPILQTLLKYDNAEAAFKLAEDYRDFSSLTRLCHAVPPIYPIEKNIFAERIRSYIERFKEEFTHELFQWYVENAEIRSLFAQSEVYGTYVDAFFNKAPHPAISWLHDIDKGRWGSASLTLLSQAKQTPDSSTRHVLLSIGKLSHCAGVGENDGIVEERSLEDYHTGLDYISVHQKLVDELREPLKDRRAAKQSLESQVEIIAKTSATSLIASGRTALLALFKRCVKELLQGRMLSNEDIFDVLTLKDKPADYSAALQLIKNTKDIPEPRQLSAFRTAWRRVFIHDDWTSITRQTANQTDGQLIAKYRHTALYDVVSDAFTYATTRHDQQESGPDRDMSLNRSFALNSYTNARLGLISPGEALITPSREDVEARWPGFSLEEVEEVLRDYESEAEVLKGLELDVVFDRVKELAFLNQDG